MSNAPSLSIATTTIAARPAAGPLTPNADPLKIPAMIPPTIPAIIPENNGAPEARAIPRQSGTATKKTIIEAGISALRLLKKLFFSEFI